MSDMDRAAVSGPVEGVENRVFYHRHVMLPRPCVHLYDETPVAGAAPDGKAPASACRRTDSVRI
jgi:hypothetical protein